MFCDSLIFIVKSHRTYEYDTSMIRPGYESMKILESSSYKQLRYVKMIFFFKKKKTYMNV